MLHTIGTSPWIRASSVLLAATVAVAGFVVVRPDCMLVERVEFEGNDRARVTELRHLAELPNGTTIWSVDPDVVAAGVARHPWVRSVEVTRRWPDTVIIAVKEHEPVALLHYDGLYYVDRDGTPFLGDVRGGLDHPSLTGISPGLERAHPDLPRLAVRDALWLLDELDTRGLVPRDEISEIAFSRTRGFTVHTAGARVVFGLDDLDAQLSRLRTLVDGGRVDLASPTWVDLAPPTVAIVRPLPRPEDI